MVKIGYRQCQAKYTLYVMYQRPKVTTLIVYVDDIVVIENVDGEITRLKDHLAQEFEIKDLDHLKYFLGIEVAKSNKEFFLSQRKYVLDLLRDVGMTGCKPCPARIDAYHRLKEDGSDKLIDAGRYQLLVERLIYLSLTRLDITYVVGVISQFMHAPTQAHMEATYRVLRYF